MTSISLLDAGKIILRNSALSVTFAFIVLIGFEWLVPGSVLPFVDIIDILPLASILIIATLVITKDSGSFSRILQTVFAVITFIALLGVLFSLLGDSGWKSLMLLTAGGLCLIVWIYGELTDF